MLKAVFTDGVDEITAHGLTQWDAGQEIELTIPKLPQKFQAHFAHKRAGTAYVVECTSTNGVAVVPIPNILLQQATNAVMWVYVVDKTYGETTKTVNLPIVARAKPEDYVYTEIELMNYSQLDQRLTKVEQNGFTTAVVKQAVEDYLTENPVDILTATVLDGVIAEVWNGKVSISPTDWEWNDITERYECIIYNSALSSNRDIAWQFSDEQAGRFMFQSLLPENGTVTVCTDDVPSETLVLTLSITERRDRDYDGTGSNLGGDYGSTAIVNTVSGEVVVMTDSAKGQFQSMKVFGKTTQDGTPTPDAPVPLVSVGDDGAVDVTVTGKNLLDFDANPYFDKQADGSFKSNKSIVTADKMPLSLPAAVYCISGQIKCATGLNYRFVVYYSDGTSDYVFVKSTGDWVASTLVTNGRAVQALGFSYATSSNEVYVKDVQVEISSTATQYEPYKGQTLTLSTPNGLPSVGDVCDEIDLERGVYVQRIAQIVFDGTEDWKEHVYNGVNQLYAYPTPTIKHLTTAPALLSPNYRAITISEREDNYGTLYTSSGGSVCFNVQEYAGLTAWKASLAERYAAGNPLTVYGQLETPIETPLSVNQIRAYKALMLNYPTTTVYTDEGAGLEIVYVADTKNYIDKRIMEMLNPMETALNELGVDVYE